MSCNNSQTMTNAVVAAFTRCGMSERDAQRIVSGMRGPLRSALKACAEAFSADASQQNTRALASVHAQTRRYPQ